MAADPFLVDKYRKYLKYGAPASRILDDSLRTSRPAPLASDEKKDSPGGILGDILRLASNLDRPAGAVRAGVLGHNPLDGFANPESYSLVDPNDNPFMRFLGGTAEAVLDPLNLVGARWMSPLAKESSFLKKFAVEAGVNVAARGASDLAAEAIPEDANPWLRGLGPLAAGLAGGAGANAGIAGAARRGAKTVEQTAEQAPRLLSAPSLDEQLARDFPEAVFAADTSPSPSTVEDAMRIQNENAQITALAQNAKVIRDETANSIGSDTFSTMEVDKPIRTALDTLDRRFKSVNVEGVTDSGKNYDKRQYEAATWAKAQAEANVEDLPDYVKIKGMPSFVAQAINGKINRSPLAHQAAMIGHSYLNTQMVDIADKSHTFGRVFEERFGNLTEKVTIKDDAPLAIKQAWVRAQGLVGQSGDGKYGQVPLGLIIREPDMFNLSPAQREAIDQVEELLKADNNLSRDLFKIPITEMETAYDPRAHMITHSDGTELTPEERMRLLGGLQSFQHHRMIDHPADIINSVAQPDYFKNLLKRMLDEAEDPADKMKLQDMINSDLVLTLRPVTFSDALSDRLAQAARARSEALALHTVRSNGGGIEDVHEMESLIGAHRISEAISVPAKGAELIRQATLSADFSLLGTHAIGELTMGGGVNGVMGGFLRSVTSDEGYYRAFAANADKMMEGAKYGLELNTDDFLLMDDSWLHRELPVGQNVWKDPVTGAVTRVKTGGTDVNLLGRGVRYVDQIQYGRMVKFWKTNTFDNTFSMMKAARDSKWQAAKLIFDHPAIGLQGLAGGLNKSDYELGTAAARFTNNLFGGLNRVEGGRTAAHNLLESLFILTPGFTRGTLGIGFSALNPLKWDAEAALSRDFAMRGFALTATVLAGLSMTINGPGTPLPNVSDPSKSDWMTLKLPGGKTISPLSRWRSSGKIAGETIMSLANGNGPLETAVLFGSKAMPWTAQRQSGLISATFGDPIGRVMESNFGKSGLGNSYAAGNGIADLAFNPETDTKRQWGEALTSSLVPATGQQVLETYREDGSLTGQGLHNLAFTIATEFFGVNSYGPSMLQQSVVAKGADWAAAHGVPPEAVAAAASANQNPLMAKDSQGRYYLDSRTRTAGVGAVAAELGISTDQVYRTGKLSDREKKATLDTMKNTQIDSFFEGMSLADAQYSTTLGQIQTALDNGVIDHEKASSLIGDARKARSAAKGVVENLNPAALIFLQSPDQLTKKNGKDLLMGTISAEYFSKDFFDPATMSYDYEAQAAWTNQLRLKYGSNFDEWQRRADEKKTPLERERDAAFKRLDQYFRVGDEMWQRSTGGYLGANEQQFDGFLRDMFVQSGIQDAGMINYLISHVKSSLKPVSNAKNWTSQARDLMRASDPQLEDDVTKWLGNQPLALKSMSKKERAYINQLLLKNLTD